MWDGAIQHLGVVVLGLVGWVAYVVAVTWVPIVRDWVRGIPTEWVLTPFLLLLVLLAVFIMITWKQHQRIQDIEQQPPSKNEEGRFVSHYGLKWLMYWDSGYMEDFPYCTCCDKPSRLVQTEWVEDEQFQCPITKVDYKIFDEFPRKRNEVIRVLFSAYFERLPGNWESLFSAKLLAKKELNPDMDEESLTRWLFSERPLNRIPIEERERIIEKYPHARAAIAFIDRHFRAYRGQLMFPPDDDAEP